MLGLLCFFLGVAVTATEAVAKEKKIPIVIASLESCCPKNAWPEVERKTEAELRFLGYDVHILQLTEEQVASVSLAGVVLRENAVAGIRINRLPAQDQGEVELWARHPEKGTSIEKRFSLQDTVGSKALSMIALRISEAVDVCLLELGLPSPRQPARATPEHPWFVSIGAFGAFAADGFALRPGLELSLDRKISSLLSLEWVFNTAPWGPSLKAKGQSFSMGYVSSSVWLFSTFKLWDRLRPAIGIGAGAYYLWSTIAETVEYASQTRNTLKGYLGLSARVGWIFSEHWQLQVGIRAGALLPQVAFSVNGQTAKNISFIIGEGIVSLSWFF